MRQQLRQARRTAGLTQQQLADKLEIDRSMISKIENGKAIPYVNLAGKIAYILGKSIEDLFCEEEIDIEKSDFDVNEGLFDNNCTHKNTNSV